MKIGLFTLLYLGGLCIAEVGENTMGRFSAGATRTVKIAGGWRCWAKAARNGWCPATSEMMVELGAYRRECGLPALPSKEEDTPLVLPIGQSRKPLTRAALHRIVKQVFSGTADALHARGETHAHGPIN
jgi:hypothetical protein